jgi:hypothetical protein
VASNRVPIAAAILAAASLFAPSEARANGVFPSSGHLLFDPSDPDTAWLRTDYGVVVTRDNGASWRLVCMQALDYRAQTTPAFALTPAGVPYVGLPDGLVRGDEQGCSYDRVPSLEGMRVDDVSQTLLGPAYAVITMPADPHRVYRSDDGSVTFTQTSSPLPLKFRPLTLDAAPSNPERLYVSGLTGPDADLVGTFARSSDGGASFTEVLVPGSMLGTSPYIAAVDPLDELRVWVRLDSAPGRLLVTSDGGDSWDVVFEGDGFLRGFALSSDGATAWVGGEADGVWRATAPDWIFEQISTTSVRCLRTTADALYGCMLPSAGFDVGRSDDGGATFEAFFVEKCLAGLIECPGGSTVATECPAPWSTLEVQLGAGDCEGGGGMSSTSNATATAATDAAASGATGGGGGPPVSDDGSSGCDCASSTRRLDASIGLLAGLGVFAAALRRRLLRRSMR